ncbi:STAS/SEC14 domain-containing protein [Flavobacterium anhuiense]|uniref:STAS/SEC14 domain-containing protein n=1 Tax=Flavobacterium anhuiense TaxID=459526 RepID=UPI003D959AC9
MIQRIDAPANVAAFRAIGEVTADDYKNILVPAVTELVNKIEEINFLFLIDTEIKNFTAAAWMEDALMGIKNIGKWNRAAIVTDSDRVIRFTKAFSYLVPGEFRGYKKDAYHEALKWVQGNEISSVDYKTLKHGH